MSAPIFEARENMGASPVAIEYTEYIMRGVNRVPRGVCEPIAIAMFIDAAIRKSGAPEMYAALRRIAERKNTGLNTDMPVLDRRECTELARTVLVRTEGEPHPATDPANVLPAVALALSKMGGSK